MTTLLSSKAVKKVNMTVFDHVNCFVKRESLVDSFAIKKYCSTVYINLFIDICRKY